MKQDDCGSSQPSARIASAIERDCKCNLLEQTTAGKIDTVLRHEGSPKGMYAITQSSCARGKSLAV